MITGANRDSMRLNKYMAACGFGSRRACDQLIRDGKVRLNGSPVTELGVQVSAQDKVVVNGRPARLEPMIYLVLNKPRDVICTADDTHDRRTVFDLLPKLPSRVYTVGRLDRHSEGLLLLTNDGELAHRLTHPRHHVEKEYRVRAQRNLTEKDLERLRRGIRSNNEVLQAKSVWWGLKPNELLMVLGEGKNRHIRRMFEGIQVHVKRLERIRIGPFKIGGLERGAFRELKAREVAQLKHSVGLQPGT